MLHVLKIAPNHFENAISGDKPFEIRDNTDRGFQKGDEILLKEFNHKAITQCLSYTGREIRGVITYVSNYEQKDGWVVFAYNTTSDKG